jgi:hypothetical protein
VSSENLDVSLARIGEQVIATREEVARLHDSQREMKDELRADINQVRDDTRWVRNIVFTFLVMAAIAAITFGISQVGLVQ